MLEYNGKEVNIGHFPDGTILMKQEIDCGDAVIVWRFENNEELIALIYLVNHLRDHRVKNIYLEMPYIPNARQDRVKDEEDVFTLKYFASIINSLDFNMVIVKDPHSYVSEALINNVKVVSPIGEIKEVLERISTNVVMFYPDEGAMKRYSSLINRPYVFGIKKRDWKTGQIIGLDVAGEVGLIDHQNILIVDDICSKGGTFYYSAKKLKELGANDIYLYVTHCENTILKGALLGSNLIKKIYTTDSIFTKEHKTIEVI